MSILFALFLVLPVFSIYDRFWYIWGSDGTTGFIIDFIEFQDKCAVRWSIFNKYYGQKVDWNRQPLSEFSESGNTITIGDSSLSFSELYNPQNSTLAFGFGGRSMDFLPTGYFKIIAPSFESFYGKILGGGVYQVPYKPGLPLVYTRYKIPDVWPLTLASLEWSMISTTFNGSLQIEIIMLNVNDYLHVSSAYILYNGKEYKENNPLGGTIYTWTDIGLPDGGNRKFGVEISTSDWTFDLACFAPTSWFAELDDEGQTTIHSTVFGQCLAQDQNKIVYVNGGDALLEVKH